MSRAVAEGREGFALAMVVLALFVLTGIALAAVVAATGQLRAANMAGQVLTARVASRAGLDRVIAETRGLATSAAGGTGVQLASDRTGVGGSWRVIDYRVSPEFHVFAGEATVRGSVSFRELRPVWWIDPEARVTAHAAVVEGDDLVVAPGGRIQTDGLLAARIGFEACGHRAALARAFGRQAFPPAGPLPGSGPWRNHGEDEPRIGLGLLHDSELFRAADSQFRSKRGCADCWQGLVVGRGDVEVTDAGRGVLAIDGSIVFEPGGSWTGIVMASGSVLVQSGAEITGLVRGGGRVEVADGGVVDGSACAALTAMESARAMYRPIPVSGPVWAAPFVDPGV